MTRYMDWQTETCRRQRAFAEPTKLKARLNAANLASCACISRPDAVSASARHGSLRIETALPNTSYVEEKRRDVSFNAHAWAVALRGALEDLLHNHLLAR